MKGPPDEVRYHISISSWYFSWSIDIKKTTNNYWKVIEIIEIIAVQLPQ